MLFQDCVQNDLSLCLAATIQNDIAADHLAAADRAWSAAQERRETEANNCSKGKSSHCLQQAACSLSVQARGW